MALITKPDPELGVGGEDGEEPDEEGAVPVTWAPGTMQVLLPGEDVKFSDPADVGGQYGELMPTIHGRPPSGAPSVRPKRQSCRFVMAPSCAPWRWGWA